MNSAKWEAETWLGRKPKVPVEIIDEGDEYLDGLTYKTSVNRRLFNRIRREGLVDDETLNSMLEHFEETLDLHGQPGYDGFLEEEEAIGVFLEDFIDMLEGAEPSDFVLGIKNRINLILEHQDVAWARTHRSPPNEGITVFLPSPDVTLDELSKRSGKLVFMSATIHDTDNLRGIFKMEALKIIEAERRFPGTLYIMEPSEGELPRVTYRNWKNLAFREGYWQFIEDVIETAARPCLVQVHAFQYLPEKFQPSQEQRRGKFWSFYDDEVMFSTRTDRGIDFKDDLCRSIIIMKYSLPNIEDVVFRTMRKLLGEEAFWAYLRDMADRNLVQQCGRAVRHQDDWCEIYTPDGEVLRQLPRLWKGRYSIKQIQ